MKYLIYLDEIKSYQSIYKIYLYLSLKKNKKISKILSGPNSTTRDRIIFFSFFSSNLLETSYTINIHFMPRRSFAL